MKVKKVWFSRLLPPPSTSAVILESKGFIWLKHKWLFGMTDEAIKVSGLEEVQVKESGIIKTLFNYGTLVLKAEGEVRAEITFVKDPHYYASYLMELKQQ